MDVPPPMPTVQDAILDLDRRFLPLTVAAVRARLKELRGFDASPREVAAALREFKDGARCAWAAEASARAWLSAAPPEELDGTTARHWLRLGFRVWDEAAMKVRKRERTEATDDAGS